MTIRVEEGKFYQRRDGVVVGPARPSTEEPVDVYPWRVGDETYTVRGGYHWRAPGTIRVSAYDLVAEASAPDEPPSSAQEMLNAAFVADDIVRDVAQQKDEPGRKMDGGKPRIDLIAPEMIFGVSEILTFGAAKYSERNWETGMPWGRYFGAGMRHLWAWWAGEKNDRETGKPHLWHAACCIMFLIAYEARDVGTDDRAKATDAVDSASAL